MWLTLVAISLLTDVPPRRIEPQCRQDDDCVVSTFQGCCPSCCPQAPRAVKRGTNEGEICIAMMCEEQTSCAQVKCAKPASVVAVCRSGRCVAEPARSECKADNECKVMETSDGCCTTRRAVPLETPVPLTKKATKYGLSAPGPTCGRCAPPTPGTASCSAGQCVLKN